MKRNSILIAVCMITATIFISCSSNNNNQKNETMKATSENSEPVLGLGNPVSANFTGEAWLQPLSSVPANDCNVYNVTFAPGTRNNWHSHAVGQILLCTEGEGWYQEKGKDAQRLRPGSVVNIPANTMHWHGATAKSRFTHIGITPKVSENATEWGGAVTDEEYNVLPE